MSANLNSRPAYIQCIKYHYASNMSAFRVDDAGDESSSSVFSLPVALAEHATHGNLHEIKDIFLNGSTPCEHKTDISPEAFPNFAEDHGIIEA